MFHQLKNIDTAFKHVRMFSIVLVLACVIISCYNIYKTHLLITAIQEKIYILSNGTVLEAYSAKRKDNVQVEGADHVSMFHYYFFTLEPDEKVIQRNVTRALYLADESAKKQYDNLKENRYYSNIISGNVSLHIEVDSVQVDVQHYPYYFRCFARQQIIRTTSLVQRSLITEGYLRNVQRSPNNSHGFLIERWNTIENKDVKTENR